MEEEFLSLSLGISSIWRSDATRKRKRPHDGLSARHMETDGNDDKKLFGLLQTRDRMLKVDAKRHGLEDGKGLRLIQMLLVSANAIDGNDTRSALDSLRELYQNASLNGDPVQRVMAYFADGLTARLLTSRSPFYATIMSDPTPEEEFSAFTELYRATPYYQFAHFTANQVIIEAFEEEEKHNNRSLHVIDFDVSYGFQWPSLIQSLSDKATISEPISLQITGIGRSVEELEETKMRLASFAKGCRNLLFEFEGLVRGSSPPSNINKMKKNATLVVNLVFCLHNLRSRHVISNMLRDIRLLNPSAVVLVEKDASWSPRSFLSGFMESLHYFAAMFDSLDGCLPAESTERLSIEKNHLGREIKGVVASYEKEEEEKHWRCEKLETWKARMETSGFEGMKLSSMSISQAKLLLKIKSHASSMECGSNAGFRVLERHGGSAISLNWQDRPLVTASAWRCIQ